MNNSINSIKISNEKTISQVTSSQSNLNRKTDFSNLKSKTTQTKSDSLELSAAARAKQSQTNANIQLTAITNNKTQQSTLEQVKQLYQQGQSTAQIAAKLGIDIATVNSYLGITSTSTNSTSIPTAESQAAITATTSESSILKSQK